MKVAQSCLASAWPISVSKKRVSTYENKQYNGKKPSSLAETAYCNGTDCRFKN